MDKKSLAIVVIIAGAVLFLAGLFTGVVPTAFPQLSKCAEMDEWEVDLGFTAMAQSFKPSCSKITSG